MTTPSSTPPTPQSPPECETVTDAPDQLHDEVAIPSAQAAAGAASDQETTPSEQTTATFADDHTEPDPLNSKAPELEDQEREDASESPPTAPAPPVSQKRALIRLLQPRATRAQFLSAALLGLLGFALVVQLQVQQQDELATLRESDLVNLLDDVTRRNSDLEDDIVRLRALESELRSGSSSQRAAIEAARENVTTQGILAGRLPAQGPGVTILLTDGDERLPAATLFNVLEELRNAGAEVIEINGIRLVTDSYFIDDAQGVEVDGTVITEPYIWTAIGAPDTLVPALEIPGGAMASVRSRGGQATITEAESVLIEAVVEPEEPEYAQATPKND